MNFMSYVDTFGGGFIVGLIAPYIISRFGGAIWTDIQALWTKATPVTTPTPVAPVAPVING